MIIVHTSLRQGVQNVAEITRVWFDCFMGIQLDPVIMALRPATVGVHCYYKFNSMFKPSLALDYCF